MARFNKSQLLGKEVAPYTDNIWANYTSWGFGHNKRSLEIVNISDEFLQQKGGLRALESYIYLLYDSTVQANMVKLAQEIISRKLIVNPASDKKKDQRVADEVRRQLDNLSIDNLFIKMLEAYIVGFSPAEIMWRKTKKGVVEAYDLRMRDPRRFVWATNSEEPGGFSMRLLTKEHSMDGIEIPPRKFIPFRYWVSNNGDPYGSGLGRILYFLVKVKRRALESEVLYSDRYATPTAIATAPLSATVTEVDKVYDLISNLSQETGIILPEGFSLDFVNPQGNPDTFQNLREYLNKEISILISGEDEAGSAESGSRASSQVALDVRTRKAQEFSELICHTLRDTLVRWIVELNYGLGVPIPSLERDFPKEEPSNLTAQEMVTIMDKLKVTPRLDWIEKHFKIQLVRDEKGEILVETPDTEAAMANFFAGGANEGPALFDAPEAEGGEEGVVAEGEEEEEPPFPA